MCEEVAALALDATADGAANDVVKEPGAKNLVFSDWVMFDRVMQDEGVCAAFLETVLGIEVERIEYLQVERCAMPVLGSKAVRMDVYTRDRARAYDVEMQASPKPDLGRRFRYYQGSMDVADLKPGQDYGEMLDSYIVFLCDYDPLKEGLPVYTVRPTCEEAPGADLEAGQTWVVLNAQAWRDAPTEGLRNLLEYVSNRKSPVESADPLVSRIDAEVERANRDSEWKEKAMGFMTLEMDHRARERYAKERGLAEGLEQGIEQGLAEGKAIEEKRYSGLVEALLAADRVDDLRHAAKDADFRQRLYQELGI